MKTLLSVLLYYNDISPTQKLLHLCSPSKYYLISTLKHLKRTTEKNFIQQVMKRSWEFGRPAPLSLFQKPLSFVPLGKYLDFLAGSVVSTTELLD